ncbi:hypothetical protein FQZ97_1113570 [compost metagenome]
MPNSQGLMPCEAVVAMPSVRPSGAALATALTPMLPPAPGLFSTITVPSDPLTASARMRAVTSIGPPGAKGTTMRVVPPAWACASVGNASAEVARAMEVMRWRRFSMVWSPEGWGR